jgi:hypothetical protein
LEARSPVGASTSLNKTYRAITMKVTTKDGAKAGAVYAKYQDPFRTTIPRAESRKGAEVI